MEFVIREIGCPDGDGGGDDDDVLAAVAVQAAVSRESVVPPSDSPFPRTCVFVSPGVSMRERRSQSKSQERRLKQRSHQSPK